MNKISFYSLYFFREKDLETNVGTFSRNRRKDNTKSPYKPSASILVYNCMISDLNGLQWLNCDDCKLCTCTIQIKQRNFFPGLYLPLLPLLSVKLQQNSFTIVNLLNIPPPKKKKPQPNKKEEIKTKTKQNEM